MKSSWICFGAVSLLILAASGAGAARRSQRPKEAIELTNFRLAPAYSQWLVGPIAMIAKSEEIERYMALTDDVAAEAFIEEFWRRREPPGALLPSDRPRDQFEARAELADAIYSEGTHRGRFTDRGTILILYGKPEATRYGISALPGRLPVEIWAYPKSAAPGLDGKRPKRRYHFIKRGDLTVEEPTAGQRLLKEPR